MQTIGCPTCGNPFLEIGGHCARCEEVVNSPRITRSLAETLEAQELPADEEEKTPSQIAGDVFPISLQHNAAERRSMPQEPDDTESTLPLPRKVTRYRGGEQEPGEGAIRLLGNAVEFAHMPQEPGDTEATLQLPGHITRQLRVLTLDFDEADTTIQLPHKAIQQRHEQLQGLAPSAPKYQFMRPGARASLEADLRASLEEEAWRDQDEEEIAHPRSWQKVVPPRTTHTMPIVTAVASEPAKRVPAWLSALIGQRSARSFFWLSTLVLIALLLSGAFGLATSFGRTVRRAVPNSPPTLLASPAQIALGGIVTLRGTYFTPGGEVTLSRDLSLTLVDTGGASVVRADAHGLFSDTIVVDPAWLAGAHTLYALDAMTGKQASFPLLVTGQNALQGPPHLLLSSDTLDLGSGDETRNASKLLAISNAGGGVATWQASVSKPWLQITPHNGTIASGQHQSVIVAADRSALAVGSYQATILFTSNTGQISLAVTLTVIALQQSHEAIMQTSPATLTFEGVARGTEPGEQTITMSNPGILPLVWGASVSGSGWLWATPAGGTIPPNGRQSIRVGVRTGGLASGVYKGVITFSRRDTQPVQGSPQSVYVSLTVTPACTMVLSTNSLSFSGVHNGVSPANKSLSIGVAQGCKTSQHWTLQTSTSSGGNWLRVSSAQGSTPVTLGVSVNLAGLAPGVYDGALTFTSSLGSKILEVTLTVTPIPCAIAGPSALALQGTAAQPKLVMQNVTINASGDCQHALNWTSSVSGGSWLNVPPSGTFTSSAAVNIQSSLANIDAGTYYGSVTIIVEDKVTGETVGVVAVAVTLTALSPPPPCTLQAPSSTALNFTAGVGANPATPTASFTVQVTGSCTGGVTITPAVDSSGSGWLAVSDATTIASGGTATFTVTITSTALAAGTYTSSVTLTPNGGVSGSPRTVTVTLTVQ